MTNKFLQAALLTTALLSSTPSLAEAGKTSLTFQDVTLTKGAGNTFTVTEKGHSLELGKADTRTKVIGLYEHSVNQAIHFITALTPLLPVLRTTLASKSGKAVTQKANEFATQFKDAWEDMALAREGLQAIDKAKPSKAG